MLVGILNVTPDSFSDGGVHWNRELAVAAGERLASEGADIIDVGGESTRPGAEPVSIEEEINRVLPVVESLADGGLVVSIDTSKPAVAAKAIDVGASVINDVTGFRDQRMIGLAAESGVGVVVMHMSGEPRTMQMDPQYEDVVADIGQFLAEQSQRLIQAGVAPEAIVIDPGFGFGKTPEHNWELFSRLAELTDLGFPVMLGTSRKSTLGRITEEETPLELDGATAVTTALGFERGARVFRVHNIPGSRDALRIAAAIVDPTKWDEWQQD